jgi:hypothetical protein
MESSQSSATIGAVDVMATSGGPHPPDLWARITAAHIIQVASSATDQARDLQARVISILEHVYHRIQEDERTALAEHEEPRPIDPLPYIRLAIVTLMQRIGTPFQAHFEQPRVQNYLHNMLGQHFATAIDVERKWHAIRRS